MNEPRIAWRGAFARVSMLCALMAGAAGGHAQDAFDAAEGRGQIIDARRLTPESGWARTDAALLWTDDAGGSWRDVSPRLAAHGLGDVVFSDTREGYAVAVERSARRAGERLVFGVTRDGGATWTESSVDVSQLEGRAYARVQIAPAGGQRVYLLAGLASSPNWSRGRLFRSDDGGASWAQLPEPPSAGALAFADARRGFQVQAPGNAGLSVTHDGGVTWEALALPGVAGAGEQVVFSAPVFHTPTQGTLQATVVGPQARVSVLLTRDAGRTWSVASERPVEDEGVVRARPAVLGAEGETLALATGTGARVALGSSRSAAERELGEDDGPALSIRSLTLADAAHGWALLASGTCDAERCVQVTRLVDLDADGRTLLRRTQAEPRFAEPDAAQAPTPDGSVISTSLGFDTCDAPSTTVMQNWRNASPFRDANIYYGGSARSCFNQTYLNAAWVTSVLAQGWRLIPTWVGPQSPCRGGSISTNTTTAFNQGVNEANAAVNALSALGLGSSTPIYYDLEVYEPTATCSPGTRAFVNGWSSTVRSRGYLAGVYAASRNIGADMVPSVLTSAPDAIWGAHWLCGQVATCGATPTVWGMFQLPDTVYANHQRIRQYWGDHTETWGGNTVNIDRDLADGPVAVGGTAPPTCPYTSIQTRVQPNASTPWTQTLSITLGQSFTVGSFQNGTATLTSCCTTLSVSGPNGFLASPANLGTLTPPAAGTYTVTATCGSLTQSATVTVNPAASCPYTSIQTRVQPNNTTPWTQTLTINQGQSFTVGSFFNGTGQLTTCCTSISVTGPNGFAVAPANLGVVTPPTAGTYTVRATCGAVTETATVTVVGTSCPFTSIQSRVQPNASTPWTQTLTITRGQSFTVGSFKNGWGVLTDCCTTISVTGPGFSASPANLGVVTPPNTGTYTVRAACGTLAENATVTVNAPSFTAIPLTNGDMETQSSAQFGALNGWGPNGGWAFHSGFPRPGNTTLGTRFGFYSAGTTETVGQLLTTRYQANRVYWFRSHAQGGGDDTGVLPYQLGYAATDGVLSSFVALATTMQTVGNAWIASNGVSYLTPASGGPVGKQIIVRFGSGANGGVSDIWFDNLLLSVQ